MRAFLDTIGRIDSLVAFWDFAEPAGEPRVARMGRRAFELAETNGLVPRVDDAPLGGHAARFDTGAYLVLPYDETHELDIGGPGSQVSIFAVVRFDVDHGQRCGTVAGMWYEGLGAGDDSGTRQYALLLDMNLYGGKHRVTPHVSSVGGASHRSDGSILPWCVDYAATVETLPRERWCSLGMTYDGTWLTAFLDGVATPRARDPVADNREDAYFTREGPGGRDRGMNPYYYGKDIFQYDESMKAAGKPHGSDFTVGARCVRGTHGAEPLAGALAGLAVFDRSLDAETMKHLHAAAV